MIRRLRLSSGRACMRDAPTSKLLPRQAERPPKKECPPARPVKARRAVRAPLAGGLVRPYAGSTFGRRRGQVVYLDFGVRGRGMVAGLRGAPNPLGFRCEPPAPECRWAMPLAFA